MYSVPLCTSSLVLTIRTHPKNRWLADPKSWGVNYANTNSFLLTVDEKNFFQVNFYCWGFFFLLACLFVSQVHQDDFCSIKILQNRRVEKSSCSCLSVKITCCLTHLLLFSELLLSKKSLLGTVSNLWVNFRDVILEAHQCWSSSTASIQLINK